MIFFPIIYLIDSSFLYCIKIYVALSSSHVINHYSLKIYKCKKNKRKIERLSSTQCKCRSEDGEDEEAILKEESSEDNKKDSDNAELAADANEENQLTRTSCHDSGIDIRDAIPTVPVVQTKKVRI